MRGGGQLTRAMPITQMVSRIGPIHTGQHIFSSRIWLSAKPDGKVPWRFKEGLDNAFIKSLSSQESRRPSTIASYLPSDPSWMISLTFESLRALSLIEIWSSVNPRFKSSLLPHEAPFARWPPISCFDVLSRDPPQIGPGASVSDTAG